MTEDEFKAIPVEIYSYHNYLKLYNEVKRLRAALKEVYTKALTSKGYPTLQSAAVQDFCEEVLDA